MKKILLVLALLAVSLGASELIIKRDGSSVELKYEKKGDFYYLSNNKKFDNKVKVIITYKDNRYRRYIESKYNLLNGRDKYGMYFIYEQNSNDVIGLFSRLSREKYIQNVHPNWIISSKKF